MLLHLQKTPSTNNTPTKPELICCYPSNNSDRFGNFAVKLTNENFAKHKNAFHFELTLIKAANLTLPKRPKSTLMFSYYKYHLTSETSGNE
jgi:hypothetical protein